LAAKTMWLSLGCLKMANFIFSHPIKSALPTPQSQLIPLTNGSFTVTALRQDRMVSSAPIRVNAVKANTFCILEKLSFFVGHTAKPLCCQLRAKKLNVKGDLPDLIFACFFLA